LKAVRTGACTFIPQPYEMQEVVNVISSIEETHTQRSYRVVIAEDEKSLAQFYQATLEHAGMDVRIVRDPSKLLETLSGFDPDIIIMDVYMTDCTGLELAQIVRQFPAYTTVPILFLSMESRLELQLQARHLGGDDFLVKPLQPAQLISAVISRSNRYRDLKKLTDRDSLTGLLNHTNIQRNLEREISVAARTGAPVSFAMVDIDHFKKVNDTYGHVVGDQVLIRVTHLLRNRLRRVDYVGRYGGEEFAVVMPNTDAVTARTVVDALREAANEIEHDADGTTFHITFSAGIATYPQFGTTLEVTQAADEALYAAKHGGRNQVVVAAAKKPA
ncbi:MAG: diguanylate cyclase, partial [Rhodospirillaceae bacterium]|nr:diguanylate cyclase [Rhodospirillaceae bacterium]